MTKCNEQKRPDILKPWQRKRVIVNLEGQKLQVDTSMGNDTDVNNIVARFARTGQLPANPNPPQYADVSGLQGDLTEMLQRGKDAAAELERAQATQAELHQQRLKDDAEKLAKYEAAAAAAAAANPPT